jgi:hypothetical protein
MFFAFVGFTINLLSYILFMNSVHQADGLVTSCNATVIVNGEIKSCEDGRTLIRNMYIIASFLSIPIILLNFVAGCLGRELRKELRKGPVVQHSDEPRPDIVQGAIASPAKPQAAPIQAPAVVVRSVTPPRVTVNVNSVAVTQTTRR